MADPREQEALNIDELRERYKALVSKLGERKEPMTKFMKILELKTDYFKSPASTKYHLCVEFGLLSHSISVAETMIKLKETLAPELSDESCVIVGLLHDLGKAGPPNKPMYLKREPTDRQKQFGYGAWPPYDYNDSVLYMEHEDRSLWMLHTYGAKSGLYLTEEEWASVSYHNQPWHHDDCKFRRNKLMTIAQYADYWAALYLEEGSSH